jgi:hypothetical protein
MVTPLADVVPIDKGLVRRAVDSSVELILNLLWKVITNVATITTKFTCSSVIYSAKQLINIIWTKVSERTSNCTGMNYVTELLTTLYTFISYFRAIISGLAGLVPETIVIRGKKIVKFTVSSGSRVATKFVNLFKKKIDENEKEELEDMIQNLRQSQLYVNDVVMRIT